MSTVKANNHQIGQSGTATNNFTLYQPSTPDGTVRLAVGNSGATTGDVLSVSNTGLSVTGTLSATGNVSFDGGTFVFNESGADKDFRIEGDTEPNLFFTDASTDRVGIGTSSPTQKFHVESTTNAQCLFKTTGAGGGSNRSSVILQGPSNTWYINTNGSDLNGSDGALGFYGNSATRMVIDSSGNLGLGVTPSAWGASFKALQVTNATSLWSSTNGDVQLSNNVYYDTGYKFVYGSGSAYASQYQQKDGKHIWQTAASGTAGATTSITSGQVYTVTTLGSTTLVQWQAYFSALSSIPSVGQSITATATGTLAGGATVTQTITFTQAMTLDASGNLVVGGTSASNRLDIQAAVTGTYSSSTQQIVARLYNAPASLGSGTNSAFLSLQTSPDGGNSNPIARIGVVAESYGSNNGAFVVATRDSSGITERARITSGGDLLVGTTSAGSGATAALLRVSKTSGNGIYSEAATTSSGYRYISNALSDGGTYYHINFQENTTQRGSITSNGSSTAYNTSSDYRLKNIDGPLTGSGEFIDALKPKVGTWKTNGSKFVGFLAHEVQEVSPGSVVGTKDAVDEEGKPIMQTMEYGSAEFIANIIAELQSLRQRVAELEGT